MKHIFKIVIVLLTLWMTNTHIYAQDNNIFNYSNKKTYEIGGITIQGAETRDRNAIKSITGLREGRKVQIPGTEIPTAIKSLLKLRLFDDVQISIDKIEGDIVFLNILLIDTTHDVVF